jgi:hypothetical protein
MKKVGVMMKTLLAIILFSCCLLPNVTMAGWQNMKGEQIPETASRKSLDDFGAMLMLTDKQDDLFAKWLKPGKVVEMDVTNKVERNELISVLIFFSGCKADTKGYCNVIANYKMWNPQGQLFREMPNTRVWVNKPGPKAGSLELTEAYVKIKPTSVGRYSVEAEVKDLNQDVKLLLRSSFEAIDQKLPMSEPGMAIPDATPAP